MHTLANIRTLTHKVAALFALASALLAMSSARAQISLSAAVDLALRNSDSVKIAQAETDRARASLSELKDAYVPSLSISSGLAKGTGLPPGDPSTFKVSAQGLVYNASQPQFVRATRAAWHASQLALENTQQQVVLDAALTYFELDADQRQVQALQQEQDAAADMVRIISDRASAGVESRFATRKTQLRAAQARLRRLQIEARADYLREHLATLTGLTADAIRTGEVAPTFAPLVPQDAAQQSALDTSPALKSAYEEARSKQYFATGQHKVNWRPEVDLLLQYGYLTDFNDYSHYYRYGLPPNNVIAGVQITLPIFNRAQEAKAREADAEATKATLIANQQRSLAGEQLIQLRRAVEETDAAADVARLQQEIAADQLEATRLRAENGGEVSGAAVTPADTAGALMEERQLAADSAAAAFEHTKAELQWMNALGTLAEWARSLVQPHPAEASR